MMMRSVRTAAIGALVLGSTACTEIDNALASVPVFAFLREAPFFDPYEATRLPAPGSVPYESPQGVALAPLEATEAGLQAFGASPAGRSQYAPLAADEQWLAYGQMHYDRQCAVCHGVQGLGDGPIVGPGKFPLAPSLVSGTALGRSEGYMYGIIRVGRGLMPAYGGRTTDRERWAIVNYVQSLQRSAGGAPATAPAAPATTPPTGGD